MEDDDARSSGGAFFRDTLVEAMQRRVDAVPSDPEDPYTIFRLPAAVRELHRDLYEPKVVSVGPYYHHRARAGAGLGAAQQHKWRLLRDFLSRSRQRHKNDDDDDKGVGLSALGAYVRAARALEAEARGCYAEAFDEALGPDDFAELLVLDGCFLLEFFLRKGEGQLAGAPGGAKWAWQHMYRDVLLLDNQIPFFVIEKLHAIAFPSDDHDALLDIFCKAFGGDLPSSRPIRPRSGKTIHHLLHLHYECNVRNRATDTTDKPSRNGNGNNAEASLAVWKQQPSPVPSPRSSSTGVGAMNGQRLTTTSMVPQASKMEEAGVTFKRKAAPRDMFDVSFRYGVLHVPAFVVDEAAKVLLANLVAFEQGGGRAARQLEGGNLVTGFVALVGSLVGAPRDVEVLRRCGVMHCMVAHDDAVRYFGHVVQYATMDYDRHLLACLFRDIREHCRWNR